MTERFETATTYTLAFIGLVKGLGELAWHETFGRHKFEANPGARITILEAEESEAA